MLIPTVHLPRLYSSLPEAEHQRTYCSLVIQCLQDAVANCILHVDAEETLPSSLRKWPPKYSGKAKELLRKLSRINRLIVWTGELTPSSLCQYPDCKALVGIALTAKPLALISSTECAPCADEQLADTEVVSIDEYPLSRFARTRRSLERIELPDRDPNWNKDRFETDILDPVLRHAKHVKVYDRNIGRSVFDFDQGVRRNLPDRYAKTLEWIFERFVTLTEGRTTRQFEVICSLDGPNMSDEALRMAGAALHQFASQCSEKYGVQMSMTVKNERDGHLRHARFFFTDQISLMIERGFDLTYGDGRLRDMVITHFSGRGQVEAELARLPDVT